MRTITVKKNSGGQYKPGWHEIEVSKANYGEFQGNRFIDVYFKGYPENINLRVYAKNGKDGEEFAIGRLFRFANAGIKGISKSADGDALVQIDDSPNELIDKKLNVYFYKKGQYSSVLTNVAPTVFKNDLEDFNEEDVDYWKSKAVDYYNQYIKEDKSSDDGFANETRIDTAASTNGVKQDTTEGMPW